MKRKISLIITTTLLVTICITTSYGQCDDKLGYNSQGSLGSTKVLKGHLSQQDTAMKMFLTAILVKTEMTKGITLFGMFTKVGTIDYTTKVKITFQDGTSITLTNYLSDLNNPSSGNKSNDKGIFAALVTDKYNLLLLKSKPITKVQITGSLLDATTYVIDGIVSLDFLLGMECLQEYL